MAVWMGVDVGGARKGFDVAVIDERGTVVDLERRLDRDAVVALAERRGPQVVAIDSPCRCAEPGETSRADERALRRAVCGIRWTPDDARVRASGAGYYGWVLEGLALHRALAGRGFATIECFPTAAWTRWHGPRGRRRRSEWSRAALAALGLSGVPSRTSQDQRDAIAAAVTAREHAAGWTECFGDIVVPVGRSTPAVSAARTRGAAPAGAA